MKRWWPVILGIVLGLVGMAIGGFLSWRKNGREETAVTFSSLAVCIAEGPARVAPEHASLDARRLHYSATDPTIETCVPFRDTLGRIIPDVQMSAVNLSCNDCFGRTFQ